MLFEDYDDEKFYSVPSPSYTPSHSKHSSYSSTNTSTLSLALSSYPEKYDESDPPPYTYVFYNTIDDKPLPPLPTSGKRERKVRFVAEKPLPPLPQGSDAEAQLRRRPKKQGSGEGEYAWWAKRWSMSDEEYEKVAREKEIGHGSGFAGKFKEEF
ncbi:uncharacterized protein LY89DRAFT_486552 [Mollisia scopiformis]|uniref:Uncharacterized protein n=1 Tax=Mollisia scopiformis TaxID=149040 RepID=A0A194XGI0_MOLSC|nr:uncharacterized protein LY89DRAFT_486552 [Mollisia scopiformis]KUJ19246.1 hypothetical protein LY89DRAFT_486552 [Mollisia scopiformis]